MQQGHCLNEATSHAVHISRLMRVHGQSTLDPATAPFSFIPATAACHVAPHAQIQQNLSAAKCLMAVDRPQCEHTEDAALSSHLACSDELTSGRKSSAWQALTGQAPSPMQQRKVLRVADAQKAAAAQGDAHGTELLLGLCAAGGGGNRVDPDTLV